MNTLDNILEKRLGWLALALLLGGCLLVVLPFLSAMLWAGILSYSLWPLYCRVLKTLRDRRTLAALVLTLGLVAIILLPVVVVGATLADNIKDISAATKSWLGGGLPAPPEWLAKIPLLGTPAAEFWRGVAADSTKLLAGLKPVLEPVGSLLLKSGIMLGGGLFQLTLSLLITFVLLRHGPVVADRLNHCVGLIGGERGQHLLFVAGNTVRGVVYGILGTAMLQGLMAGLGLWVAGVPGPGLLAMMVFFLSVVPAGPFMVMFPAALWLFHQGATGWAIFMLIWGLGVGMIDNFVRPWLISQGSVMPFLLILMGVLGGAVAFGFIGVFIGPTLLAVGHRIIGEWVATSRVATASNEAGKVES